MSTRQLAFLGFVAVATFVIAVLTGPMVVDRLIGSSDGAKPEASDASAPASRPTGASGSEPHPSTVP